MRLQQSYINYHLGVNNYAGVKDLKLFEFKRKYKNVEFTGE